MSVSRVRSHYQQLVFYCFHFNHQLSLQYVILSLWFSKGFQFDLSLETFGALETATGTCRLGLVGLWRPWRRTDWELSRATREPFWENLCTCNLYLHILCKCHAASVQEEMHHSMFRASIAKLSLWSLSLILLQYVLVRAWLYVHAQVIVSWATDRRLTDNGCGFCNWHLSSL